MILRQIFRVPILMASVVSKVAHSAAAIETVSNPIIENMTVVIAVHKDKKCPELPVMRLSFLVLP